VDNPAALEWWAEHLGERRVKAAPIVERDGRATLDLEDPEGQRLSLVADGAGPRRPWDRSSVPPEHQVRGLGPILLSVPALPSTDALLQQVLGMRPVREYPHPDEPRHTVHVYEMGPGGAAAELHVAVEPGVPPAQQGAGGVHHVAFRSNDADYEAWADRLNRAGVPNSGMVDRYWFRSLYFREPNGILFEIATEGPGFGVDEDLDTLGEKVVLAPFLEPRRAEIVANLKPID
jgi:glyoxalase family protein